MTVCVPRSTIYKSPSFCSEHTDDVFFGEEVEIREIKNGFAGVITEYGYQGWINESDISETSIQPNSIVTSRSADLLPEPRNFFSPILSLPMGSRLAASEYTDDNRYMSVTSTDGKTAYIRKEHISVIPHFACETEARKTVCETAKSFLGTPYRWGGRTHSGVDCSGLVFTSYRMAGITLWRDTVPDKVPNMKHIAPENAKPGDLLFFPGHIALYLGNDKFIHASNSAAVTCFGSFDERSKYFNSYLKNNIICMGTVF